MVDIQNSKITDRMLEETKAQPYFELPKKIMDSIQPVLIVNPIDRVFLLDAVLSDATSGAIFTTRTDRDTFVLAASLSTTKSVLALSTRSFITCFPFASPSKAIIGLMYEPVTAGSSQTSLNLQEPLKLERGSVISVTHSNATASIDSIATIILKESGEQ